MYKHGFRGLLLGDSVLLDANKFDAEALHAMGGSPIGSSRVKLTNIEDCRNRGYLAGEATPMETVAQQLVADQIEILHPIGGDDTNVEAGKLSAFLRAKGYSLTVVGLCKTVDNDIAPIYQTMGSMTAAIESARFFEHVVNECTAAPRTLIVHECMGRFSGYLTSEAARQYRTGFLANLKTTEDGLIEKGRYDVHAILIPELPVDIESLGHRLERVMDRFGNVNIFLSEGAGLDEIIREKQARGEFVQCDAFGHPQLDKINPGAYYAAKLKPLLHAEKVLVQKSGYFARSAKSGDFDRFLIDQYAEVAVEGALAGICGVAGKDEERQNEVRIVEFDRIRGGRKFDTSTDWFVAMLGEVEQHGCGAVL
jgi:pyrophosphate--fructose-6-phosphate 1-phosphotransferase